MFERVNENSKRNGRPAGKSIKDLLRSQPPGQVYQRCALRPSNRSGLYKGSMSLRSWFVALAWVVVLLAAGVVRADVACYGVTWTGNLYQIDPSTAQATLVGATGFNRFNSLAVNSSGTLYGVRGDFGAAPELIRLNPQTGAGTLMASIDLGMTTPTITALAFSPDDILYAVQGYGTDSLWTVDAGTGQASKVGDIGSYGFMGADFESGGSLYAWDIGTTGYPADGDGLFTINPSTAVATDVHPSGPGGYGQTLAFAPNGTLYLCGGTSNVYGSPFALRTVNTVTGATTLIGQTVTGIRGLAFLDSSPDVPEPFSLTFLGTGMLGVLGFVARRKMRKVS